VSASHVSPERHPAVRRRGHGRGGPGGEPVLEHSVEVSKWAAVSCFPPPPTPQKATSTSAPPHAVSDLQKADQGSPSVQVPPTPLFMHDMCTGQGRLKRTGKNSVCATTVPGDFPVAARGIQPGLGDAPQTS
jgi:hypothetical protein